MELYINSKELEELKLTPSLYCYLYSLYINEPYTLANEALKFSMNLKLQSLGFLKIIENGIALREPTNKLFKENDISKWIDDWRNIFPKNVKSGNRPVRGDKNGILTKMQSFLKNNPQYTKSQIFDATHQYVFEASLKHYQFMICADYFINKNGNSVLAATIEDIAERGSTLSQMSKEGSNWHKEI